jgi:hypothetical protein
MDNSPTVILVLNDSSNASYQQISYNVAAVTQQIVLTGGTATYSNYPSPTTSSLEETFLEDLRALRSFTPREKALVSAKHFRPERTPSRSSVMAKLRSLQLDVRCVPQAFPTSPSSKMTRRTPASSWQSALRRFSGRRS